MNANPADGGETLLGLFPAVAGDGKNDGAAILAAVSCDGQNFSAPAAIHAASHVGGEIVDHVVDGLGLDGDDVIVYVHAGVPGTQEKACVYAEVFPKDPVTRARAPAPDPATKWRPPPSELLGLVWPLQRLRAFTRGGVARLKAAGRCGDVG